MSEEREPTYGTPVIPENLPALLKPKPPVLEGELVERIDVSFGPYTRRLKSAKRKKKWRAPTDAVSQAWELREYLRKGPHALVLSCERTKQVNPSVANSPVIVCAPDNCEMPCFNCMIAILTGRKKWV